MMAARVRIGAHFLSDTTMSLIIASLVTLVATKAIGYSFIEEESLNQKIINDYYKNNILWGVILILVVNSLFSGEIVLY